MSVLVKLMGRGPRSQPLLLCRSLVLAVWWSLTYLAPAAHAESAGEPAVAPEPEATESAGAASNPGAAAEPEVAKRSTNPLAVELKLERRTLPNGLRIVLNEDHSSPNVAICMTYDVGSRNEVEGQSGFAHLFEHMMFQGSRNVEKGEHFKQIASRGGRMNGTTNSERTNYFEVLPSSELALGLWLEADRLKTLALNEQNFENQRKVVQEEYRMRYANRVYGLGRIRLAELVFQGNWPYAHPTIGNLEDLDGAKLSWARDFHNAYYAPNNAVLSVAGDFEPKEAMTLIESFFGDARPNDVLPRFEPEAELPRQTSERFTAIVDESAKTPALFLGWTIPKARTAERFALELASEVLTGGESGRLYQSLVIEKASALSVSSWTGVWRAPGLFAVKAVVAPLSNVDTAQKWLDGELKRLRLIGPTEAELERARARLETRELLSLQENQNRAAMLGIYEVYFGDAKLLVDDLYAYRSISTEDVRKAAQQYLVDTRRSVVEVYPPGWVRDLGPVITTTTYIVKKGDTLIGIAKKHGTTAAAIAKQNGISTGRPIHPGQRLLVTLGPGAAKSPKVLTKKHTVKKGDTLIGIAKKYGTTATAIAKENKISTKKAIYPGQELNITIEVSSGSKSKSNKKTPPRPKKKK